MSNTLEEYYEEQMYYVPDRTYERPAYITSEELQRVSLLLHRDDFLPTENITFWYLMKLRKDELYNSTGCRRHLPKRTSKKEMLGWLLLNHCRIHRIPLAAENYVRVNYLKLPRREPKFNWFLTRVMDDISTDLFVDAPVVAQSQPLTIRERTAAVVKAQKEIRKAREAREAREAEEAEEAEEADP